MNLVCIALLVGCVAAVKESLRAPPPATPPFMICHVTMECVSIPGSVGDEIKIRHHNECSPIENEFISDYSYPIDLPADFVQENRDALMSGKLFANIPGGEIINGNVVYPFDIQITVASPPESFEARHRKLSRASGTKSILVLRISANDATTAYSASQLYRHIFDKSNPGKTPSLSSQYKRMSFGKLYFVPTKYGVVEVPVKMLAKGAASSTIRNGAIAYVSAKFGVSSLTQLADHVMFCIPPGTGNWAGSSPLTSWRIVMNNAWCGYISGYMHEIGHNLGLMHSNMNNVAYMDLSSYMSAGYATPYYPIKTINGANHAQLGWFSDRMLTVNPAKGGKVITLATFVDYGKSNKNAPVLIKVGTNVFLQYNRAKGFNVQAQQSINQITIVQQQNNGTSLLGAVDPYKRPKLTIKNFGGSGRNVVIYACSRGFGDSNNPDWTTVSIGYDRNYCNQGTKRLLSPTAKPSRRNK